jgi:hypothetical protein
MTPSVRFPLLAGGTEWGRFSDPLTKWEEPNPYTIPLANRGDLRLRAVPLAKRREPKGGGAIMNLNAQLVIPIAQPKFTKTAVDDPLLKVPPDRRGNRTLTVPLAKRGEPKGGGQL